MKLGQKFAFFFIVFSILFITTNSIITYFYVKSAIETRVKDQLNSVFALKNDRINTIIESEKINLLTIASETQTLLYSPNGDKKDIAPIRDLYKSKWTFNPNVIEFQLIDTSGKVIVSTSSKYEGISISSENYFTSGLKKNSVEFFNYDPDLEEPAMVVSVPLKNTNQETVAVLAEKININEIDKVLQDRTGLGKTGETFLINYDTSFIGQARSANGIEYKQFSNSQVVNECFSGKQGNIQYLSYSHTPVYGLYKLVPEGNLCMVSEINVDEVNITTYSLRNLMIIISVIVIILVTIAGFVFANSITKPILHLTNATEKIKEGNLDTQIAITSQDEIGQLAKNFNQMAVRLQESYGSLQQKINERTEELEKSNKQLETNIGELERMNKLMVGRELRMVELKKELDKYTSNNTPSPTPPETNTT